MLRSPFFAPMVSPCMPAPVSWPSALPPIPAYVPMAMSARMAPQAPAAGGIPSMTAELPSGRLLDLQMMREDLMGELGAINQYVRHATAAADRGVRDLLNHIANDEREHVAELTNMIRKLDPEQEAKFRQPD